MRLFCCKKETTQQTRLFWSRIKSEVYNAHWKCTKSPLPLFLSTTQCPSAFSSWVAPLVQISKPHKRLCAIIVQLHTAVTCECGVHKHIDQQNEHKAFPSKLQMLFFSHWLLFHVDKIDLIQLAHCNSVDKLRETPSLFARPRAHHSWMTDAGLILLNNKVAGWYYV